MVVMRLEEELLKEILRILPHAMSAASSDGMLGNSLHLKGRVVQGLEDAFATCPPVSFAEVRYHHHFPPSLHVKDFP